MSPMMGMMNPAMGALGGICSDGTFSLAEAHTEKSEPTETEQLETPELVEPVLEATSSIVDSTPKESSPAALIALASGSFFIGLFFTMIILRCKRKRTSTEDLDFNYTLEPDTVPRRV